MDGLKTPMHDMHKTLGGNMVSFGGYLLPTHYSSINHEHNVVRSKAGLFDVSHMGEFIISGNDAELFLQEITINDICSLDVGQAQYTAMCYGDGGIVDDIILYKFKNKFMLVVNSNNIGKNFKWINKNLKANVKLKNVSDHTGLVAIQGPRSRDILQLLTNTDLNSIKFYNFVVGKVNGVKSIISRTGYTGELGYELYIDSNLVGDIWNKLLDIGSSHGLEPVGLGCRDTLRLEMKYPLYGNDIDENTNPIEAGLGWITKLDKESFIGKKAIIGLKNNIQRRLVCIEMKEKSIPRKGYLVYRNNNLVGRITSGTMSPSLGIGIGVGYVNLQDTGIGTEIDIEIRGKRKRAKIVKSPFYKNGSLMK